MLMNAYEFFKFFTLRSISRHGTYIMKNVSSLHMTQLARKETIFNNLLKLIALKFISTTLSQ